MRHFTHRLAALLLFAFVASAPSPARGQTVPNPDVNRDGIVNQADVAIVQGALGQRVGQPGYIPNADVNGDGVINTVDLTIVRRNLGKTYPVETPTIVATVTPAANANGWHRTSVTVSFACTHATSCPEAIEVTTEGAGQVIERTVQSSAGATATASVTLNVDKTAPRLTIGGQVRARPDETVQFTVEVADLSGPELVEFFEFTTRIGERTSGPFAFDVTVPPDAAHDTGRTMFARVRDRAGNVGTATRVLVVDVPDTTPPVVAIEAPAAVVPGGLVPIVVRATDNGALALLELDYEGTPLGSASAPPFEFQFNHAVPPDATENTPLTFSARAVDDAGNEATTEATVVVASIDPTGDGTPLRVTVDPPLSPTFQPTAIITGVLGEGTPRPPASRTFVASIAPLSAEQGQELDVVVTGYATAFEPQESLITFGPGIEVGAVTVQGPTSLSARVRVARDAGVGPRVVVVTTGNQEAALLNAFHVTSGTTRVTGRARNAGGQALANALVCVPGTSLCTTTAADGTFTLLGVPVDLRRVVIQAEGYLETSLRVSLTLEDAEDLGEIELAEVDVPPPPPPPNSPPVPPRLAAALGRGATEILSGPQKMEVVMKMVEDTIIAVGGPEVGVLDAGGHQLNPQVAGDGYWSFRHSGVEATAQRMIAGDAVTLGETLKMLLLSFRYPGPEYVPSMGELLNALQAEVDAVWADPSRPGAALMMVLFNQGRTASAAPPSVRVDTLLNELQQQLLVATFLTFLHRQYVEPFQRAAGEFSPTDRVLAWAGSSGSRSRVSRDIERAFATNVGGRAPAWVGTTRLAQGDAPPAREPSHAWGNVWQLTLEAKSDQVKANLPGVYSELCTQTIRALPGGTPSGPPPPEPSAADQFRTDLYPPQPSCAEVVKLMGVLLRDRVGDVVAADAQFFRFFEREGVPRHLADRARAALHGELVPGSAALRELADGVLESQSLTQARQRAFRENVDATWGAWAEAQAEARKYNLIRHVADAARGYAEDVLSKQQGAVVRAIFQVQADLIIQSLRPRPPVILRAEQVTDPTSGEKIRGVLLSVQRSDNDRGDQHDANTVWSYELWRQNASRGHERIALQRFPGDRVVLRFVDEDPPLGNNGYYVIARRRVGGPIEYAPTTFDTAIAPLLAPFVPTGLSLPGGGFASAGSTSITMSVSFDTLKTVLDPAATILRGLAYQVSDPSEVAIVTVSMRTAPAPIAALAIDPLDRQAYLSLPAPQFEGLMFSLKPTMRVFARSGFKVVPEGVQAGLAVDSLGYVYTNNVSGNAQFGGRIFRYAPYTGARSLAGTMNYYSQLLMRANPTSVQAMAFGPGMFGETLFVADGLNQRITNLKRPEAFAPGEYPERNVSQVWAQSPLFNFENSGLVVRHDTTVFFNQQDNVIKVPPQHRGIWTYTAAPLFQPGTSIFENTSGVAADVYGNLYVSDLTAGTIVMLPQTKVSPLFTGNNISPLERKLFTVMRGLPRPSDVKLRGDLQGLAFFDAESPFREVAFGLSARVLDTGGNPLSGAMVVLPERGKTAIADADGVVVIPDLLDPARSNAIEYTIRHQGEVSSGILGLNRFQHNVVTLTFEPEPPPPGGTPPPLRLRPSPIPPVPPPPIAPTGPVIPVQATATIPAVVPTPGPGVPPPPTEEPDARCPIAQLLEPGHRVVVTTPTIAVRGFVSDPSLGSVGLTANQHRHDVPLSGHDFELDVALEQGLNRLTVVVTGQVLREGQCGQTGVEDEADMAISSPVDVFYAASPESAAEYRAQIGFATAIRGRVLDSVTGTPLVGLPIEIPGTGIGTTTDAFGTFQLNVTLPDFLPAVEHANTIVGGLTAEFSTFVALLRAGEEVAAAQSLARLYTLVEEARFRRAPIAAVSARPVQETLVGLELTLVRLAHYLTQSEEDPPDEDIDRVAAALDRLGHYMNVDAIEVTSSVASDLSIAIRVTP